jgi:hypothetical protein
MAHYPQSWKPSAKMFPYPQVAEAISQSDSNPSGYNSKHIHSNKVLFANDKLPDWIIHHQ